MKLETKKNKEQNIIEAAEKVFALFGFKNARMEEVAREAGITKVTLYAYFKSKENLYMAITYSALTKLALLCEECIEITKLEKGIESVQAIMAGFIDFCEKNYLYSEVLLDYFSLIRTSSDDQKLTDAIKESTYFQKVQDLQNLPFKLTAMQIKRGIEDGSIRPSIDANTATLYGWAAAVGYVKISTASGGNSSLFFKVKMSDLKATNLEMNRRMMENV